MLTRLTLLCNLLRDLLEMGAGHSSRGFDPNNSLLINDDQRLDPRIKGVQNFVHETESWDVQDEIGHGTHALGLLLQVATCAEIYIARVANQKTLNRDSYDAITKARIAAYRSKSYTYANFSGRRSITQSLSGMWILYRCPLEFANIMSR
ncbi:hypothetical protein AWENTII_007096 [Aspergillus wentii]